MATQPLTPRKAAKALCEGAEVVEAILSVDPPTVSGGKVRGGDAGVSVIARAVRESSALEVTLVIAERFRGHHVGLLARELHAEGGRGKALRLTLRDQETLSWDVAGQPPQLSALLLPPSESGVRITHLDVSGSSVDDSPSPLQYLTPIAECPTLESVALRHLGDELPENAAEDFCEGLKALVSNERLLDLDMTHNLLGERFPEALKCLEEKTHHRKLLLSWNEVKPEGLKFLLPYLQANERLEVLHLGRNSLGSIGGKFVARAVRRGNVARLRELELNDNNLGSSCSDIVRAFQQTQLAEGQELALQHLGLHGNDGEDSVAVAVARLLSRPRARNLRSIDLSSNDITPQGVRHLRKPAEKHKSLAELNLNTNPKLSNPPIDLLYMAVNRPDLMVSVFEAAPLPMHKALQTLRSARCADGAGFADDAELLRVLLLQRPLVAGDDFFGSVAEYVEGGEGEVECVQRARRGVALCCHVYPDLFDAVVCRAPPATLPCHSLPEGVTPAIGTAFAAALSLPELFEVSPDDHPHRLTPEHLLQLFSESLTLSISSTELTSCVSFIASTQAPHRPCTPLSISTSLSPEPTIHIRLGSKQRGPGI